MLTRQWIYNILGAVRQTSGSSPADIREQSGRHPGAVRQTSGSSPADIREQSGRHPRAVRQTSGSGWTLMRNSRLESRLTFGWHFGLGTVRALWLRVFMLFCCVLNFYVPFLAVHMHVCLATQLFTSRWKKVFFSQLVLCKNNTDETQLFTSRWKKVFFSQLVLCKNNKLCTD